MERMISDTDITISNSAKERILRRLNESEDKTRHFLREGTSPYLSELHLVLFFLRGRVRRRRRKKLKSPLTSNLLSLLLDFVDS